MILDPDEAAKKALEDAKKTLHQQRAFEDTTDDSALRKKTRRGNPENERTIIDREMSGELLRALNNPNHRSRVAVPVEETTIEPDLESSEPPLAFGEATIPAELPGMQRHQEQTMIDVRVLGDSEEEHSANSFIDSLDEETDDQPTVLPPRGKITRSRIVDPPTEAVPGSFDEAREAKLLESPRLPAHMLKELGPPIENARQDEMTVLDVAAQLGLAPEKLRDELALAAASAPEPLSARSMPKVSDPTPLLEQGAVVAEMVKNEVDPLAGHPVFKNLAQMRKLQRGETMFEHLPRWLSLTEGAAKMLPVILGVFVLFATIGTLVTVFSGVGGHETEHVSLKFLAAGNVETAALDKYAPTPMITLETEPAGVLVVLDRKILGATPLTFELPVRASRVGLELTSPYFETFVTEAAKNEAGEVRVRARLIRKR